MLNALYFDSWFVIDASCVASKLHRVRQLIGKPVGSTPPDCEFEARRIHNRHYETDFSEFATVIKAVRIHSDLLLRDLEIAARRCFASGGVNLAENNTPLAFCVPIFGLPGLFFIVFVYKYVDSNLISVYSNCKIKIAMANNLGAQEIL